MNSPYLHYQDLLNRWMKSFQASAVGISKLNDIRNEAADSFGEGVNNQEEEDRNQKLKSNLSSMILISLTVVLESMVKAYARFLLLPNCEYKDTQEEDGRNDDTVYRYYDIGQKHNDCFWEKKVDDWISEELKVNDSANQDIVKKIIKECALSFEKWPLLLESIVIRNLIIHNNGIMNDLNHKKVPICDIGKKPKWGKDLIYELFDTMHLLNLQFANIRME